MVEESLRSGERNIVHRSNLLEFGKRIAPEHSDESFMSMTFSSELLEGYKNITRETPDGHDAFWQAWKGYLPNMDRIYDTINSAILSVEQRTRKDIRYTRPYITTDDANQRVEINIHKWLRATESRQEITSDLRAEGQRGTTYLPPGPARDVVYLLEDKGAGPTVINKVGYTPECLSYRPQDLAEWHLRPKFADCLGCEPLNCFDKGTW